MLYSLRIRALSISALAIVCALFPMRALTQTSFSEHSLYNSPSTLTIVGHGDFNNDGREDLVALEDTSSGTPGGNLLFLSNGDGTYDAPVALSSKPVSQGQFVVGDFNHDGNLDYAVLDASGKGIDVWIGHGDGTFQNNVVLSTSENPIAIAAADMNHDNATDIIVVSAPGGTYANIQIWLGQSGSSFGSFDGGQSITSGVLNPAFITTGDFDGDGKPDLALIQEFNTPTVVQVFYGDGKGNLGSPTQLADPNNYGDLWDVNGIGDIDGNGTSDLVMAQASSAGGQLNPRIGVFKGNTNRTLSYATISTPNGCPGSQIQIADYNGDGLNDLVYNEFSCSGTGPEHLVVNPATSKGVFSGNEQVIASSDQYYSVGYPLVNVKSTRGAKPDLVFTEFTQTPGASGIAPMRLNLLENSTSGSFPGCGTTAESQGINVCTPSGASANSPVQFSISASGPTPMRTVAVWADGQKVGEQLTHSFSNYSFLDQSVTLSSGAHNITIYGTGWDNTLQQKTFTLNVGGSSGCGAPSSPGVNVCKPANGVTTPSPLEVQAAANITGTLARMEVWVDGTKMFTETTSTSFDTSLNLPNGYHKIDVYAANTAGNLWETTSYVTIGTPTSCAAPSSPGVHVCSPANNSTVNAPVNVSATAAITGSLARMEIWVNGVKKYTETTSTSMNASVQLGSGKWEFDIYAVNTAGTKWETTVYATVP
jgi:hypothetical protein